MNCIKMLLITTLLLLAPGCLSAKAKESAVLPAARGAWVGVRADVELGIEHAPDASINDVGPAVAQLDSALASGLRAELMLVRWQVIEPYAVRGVQWRVASGEISEMVATSFYQRIVNFSDALAMLTSIVFVSPRRSELTWTVDGPAVAWYGSQSSGDKNYYYNLPRRRLGLKGN